MTRAMDRVFDDSMGHLVHGGDALPRGSTDAMLEGVVTVTPRSQDLARVTQ